MTGAIAATVLSMDVKILLICMDKLNVKGEDIKTLDSEKVFNYRKVFIS